MTEPAVALTDYGITVECAILAVTALRRTVRDEAFRAHLAVFFASAAVAALAGGTVHGFFLNDGSTAGAALWKLSLLALGVMTIAAWSIGARILFSRRVARVIETLAVFQGIAYAVLVIAMDDRFLMAIVNYAPSMLFLGAAFIAARRRAPEPPAAAGVAGIALTIVAAVVQRTGTGIHPAWFDHNALYHAIQMVAFALIFIAGRGILAASETRRR